MVLHLAHKGFEVRVPLQIKVQWGLDFSRIGKQAYIICKII